MDYVQIINTLFSFLFTLFGLLVSHFVIFAIVGIFFKKSFPKTDEKKRYGIIIPARNEEAVLANLIDSIKKSDYPQDKLHIFLVAHNCTDNTAKIGRSLGATVYEYNNSAEATMGYAFRYLFSKINEDFGTDAFDGFVIFNADNIVSSDYFLKLNDAFVAEKGESVITSFRNSKNFGENVISAMYGLYFIFGCRLEARGRTVLGCSTRIQGTGYVIGSDIVRDGWKYVTLTEDWEFTADQLLQGKKIVYCDDAVFYDEQPTNVRIMWRQRVRWARGHLLVFISRYKDIVKDLFSPKVRIAAKYISLYDFSVNILPIGVIGVGLAAFHLSALLFAPLFGDFNITKIILDYLSTYATSISSTYVTVVFSAIIILFLEKDRIGKTNRLTLFSAILLWPAFILLSAPCDVAALFSKKLEWKEIPHKSKTSIDELRK